MRRTKNDIEIKAIIKANCLLNECYVDYPDELNIDEIALYKDCIIKEAKLNGHNGRIVNAGDCAVITIDQNLENGQKNFVKAHELGHKLFEDTLSIYACDENDLKNTVKYAEALPNQFAAELLMKRDWFLEAIRGKKLDFELMKNLSELFNTSLMSVCIRFARLTDDTAAFVYSERGRIKWKALSVSFPYRNINEKLSSLSYAKEFFDEGIKNAGPEEVELSAWFVNDEAYRKETYLIEENLFMTRYGGVLTMLRTR